MLGKLFLENCHDIFLHLDARTHGCEMFQRMACHVSSSCIALRQDSAQAAGPHQRITSTLRISNTP